MVKLSTNDYYFVQVEIIVLKQENEALSNKIVDLNTKNEKEHLESQLAEANLIIEKLKVALSSNTQIPKLEEEIVKKDEEI